MTDAIEGGYRDFFENMYKTGNASKPGGGGGVNFDNTVFTDKKDKGVTADDFLKLMVAQLTNQDFMNPVDDTQYVTQLAQFATMQQMQELAMYQKSNYVMSMVGKEVTAAKFKVNGDIERIEGIVDKVSLVDNEFVFYVGEKSFTLEQIMEVKSTSSTPGSGSSADDYAKKNLLMSLVGRVVTATKKDDKGYLDTTTGVVDRVSIEGGKYLLYIGDKEYTLDQLVSVDAPKNDSDSGDEDDDAARSYSGGGVELPVNPINPENPSGGVPLNPTEDPNITGGVDTSAGDAAEPGNNSGALSSEEQ